MHSVRNILFGLFIATSIAAAGDRVYTGDQNSNTVSVIDPATNKYLGSIRLGNLRPLGSATQAVHIQLVPPVTASLHAQASVSINSLGLIDNLQIVATGLERGKRYRLQLVGGPSPIRLSEFTAGIGRGAVAQTLGPLKQAVTYSETSPPMRLELRSNGDGDGDLVLQQSAATPVVSN